MAAKSTFTSGWVNIPCQDRSISMYSKLPLFVFILSSTLPSTLSEADCKTCLAVTKYTAWMSGCNWMPTKKPVPRGITPLSFSSKMNVHISSLDPNKNPKTSGLNNHLLYLFDPR